ncbi:hypothetical protein NFI96_012600, partial [Prochilodus magdalenae]
PDDDEQKVKTQRPRSADQPGVFQAQTGDPAAEEWSQWSVCSLTCGQGWQVRTRSCVSSPYGTLCSGPLRETRLCNNTATCPGEPQHQADLTCPYLHYKNILPKSLCYLQFLIQPRYELYDISGKARSSFVNKPPHAGPNAELIFPRSSKETLPSLHNVGRSMFRFATQPAWATVGSCGSLWPRLLPSSLILLVDLLVFAVHGLWEEWSPWSLCSVTCGRGSRTRSRTCVAAQHGSKGCGGPEVQTKLCNIAVCPVEGQWLDWSPWSPCSASCGAGSQQRQRRCSVSVHGWAECKGPHAETRDCTNPSCGGGGNWGAWSQWSLCSKTCDSGWQHRSRMCESTGAQDYPCNGDGEEVRTCNDKKCPAPHEICRDEYQVSMTWKRASAGETVYHKCPSNATGSASRRCLLDSNGVAYWGPPSFARCISTEFRYLLFTLREHLAKGQRTLAGEGMSQIVRTLLELMSRRSYYSGDLLFSVEILRNVTDTFKRATYIPAPDDVQKFFQVVSLMLDMENLEKWEDAHQVSPGAVLLMRIVEDFIHHIGEAQKPFQSFLVVTTNLIITIQREPVSAVSSDINFPMKGRRGMKDWARSADDKLFIPKEVFTLSSDESDEASYFVIGAILYRTLNFILPAPKDPLVISSKILTVTVRPLPKPTEPVVVVELAPLLNGTSDPQCVVWDQSNPEAGEENWDTEGCQTLPSPAVHTKCLCSKISTFAVLAQKAKDPDMGPSSLPSVPLMVGCGVSCTALLILLLIYAAFWRYIRSERSIILVNFCLSILASNVLILVGQSQTLSKQGERNRTAPPPVTTPDLPSEDDEVLLAWGLGTEGLCTVTAAFLHFFFLASFCWVLTEAWQSYLAVIGKMRTRLIRKRFLCLGWGLPALVVAVSVGFTRARGYGTASYCWLSLEGGLLYAFVGPAAVIVLVNMLIGIVVFNKLMSRDGISDKSKKQRAGASLWSSCVVLPLLALTWMSAVLAITDRRSTLFQVLFAVFDSVQGFVIITVHCAMRREVQDAVRCRMGGCKDDSENSPDSCKNGQVQIMTDFEKDVDLACQTGTAIIIMTYQNVTAAPYIWKGNDLISIIFKEVNTCNPATITGTLSRISLDDEDDPKLAAHQEGVNFSSLPGNIPPPNLLVQVPPLGPLNELSEQSLKKEVNVEQGGQQQRQRSGPVYLCTESGLGWARPPPSASEPTGGGGGGGGAGEGDYMVLPRRTVSLKPPPPPPQDEGKPLNITVDDPPFPPPPSPLTLHPAESEAYPADFATVDHISMNLNRSYGTLKQLPAHANAHNTLQVKQGRPSVRHILTSGTVERTRTLPRNLGSTNTSLSAGSLERKRVRYSELDFEKVMHTRKRHSELYHELNHSTKFHTIDRYNRDPAMSTFKPVILISSSSHQREKRWSISSAGGEKNSSSDKSTPDEQRSWDSFKTMTPEPSCGSGGQKDRVELHSKTWDASSANTPDTSEGDFQTEV